MHLFERIQVIIVFVPFLKENILISLQNKNMNMKRVIQIPSEWNRNWCCHSFWDGHRYSQLVRINGRKGVCIWGIYQINGVWILVKSRAHETRVSGGHWDVMVH